MYPQNGSRPTIVEFLTARLEDEREAAELLQHWPGGPADSRAWTTCPVCAQQVCRYGPGKHGGVRFVHTDSVLPECVFNPGSPARTLRRVEAQRQILAMHTDLMPSDFDDERGHCLGCGFGGDERPLAWTINECQTLRALALEWVDHPAYQPEWSLT